MLSLSSWFRKLPSFWIFGKLTHPTSQHACIITPFWHPYHLHSRKKVLRHYIYGKHRLDRTLLVFDGMVGDNSWRYHRNSAPGESWLLRKKQKIHKKTRGSWQTQWSFVHFIPDLWLLQDTYELRDSVELLWYLWEPTRILENLLNLLSTLWDPWGPLETMWYPWGPTTGTLRTLWYPWGPFRII